MFGLIKSVKTVRKLTEFLPKMSNKNQLFAYSSGVKLEDNFRLAQQNIKKLREEPSNEVKLKLYSLFKQSTAGNCNTPKPSALNFVEKAKWTAWNSLGQMSSSDAMTQYINAVEQILKENGIDGSSDTSSASDGSTANKPESGILVEKRDGVCVITLNRPKKYNAIDGQMYEEWANALNTASNDESIKLGLITANGDYYCSGNDLGNFEKAYKEYKGDIKVAAKEMAKMMEQFVAAFIDFKKPLIGAVNGPAIGISVTTLALMDCVIASDTATFQTPFTSLGQSPEACSTYTFPLIMGSSKASEMLYFNHKMNAKEALECGFISRIIPKDRLKAYIEEWIFGDNGLVNTCYPKSMQCGKALVRNEEMIRKLHKVNHDEADIIKDKWISDECLQALQKFSTRKKSNL